MRILVLLIIPFLIFSEEKVDLKKQALSETFLPLISTSDSINSIKSLKSDFKYLLSQASMKGANYSISVFSLDRDSMLFDFNASKALTPASLTKLFTTFNAVENLGADFQVPTQVYVEDSDSDKETISGNLYIKGGGDALFSKNELDTLFQVISKSGIKNIKGNIYIDVSQFDEETSRFKYSGDNDVVQNVGKITAFNVSRRPFNKTESYIQKSMIRSNVHLAGEISYCQIPDYTDDKNLKLVIEFQRPLKDLITITNKRSDNYLAEHIFKLNGSHNSFSENDWESSLELLYRTTDSLGIPFTNCKIHDGSGLSRRNLLSSEAIVKMFSYVNSQKYKDTFFNSLSIAGNDGTLKSRMIGSHAENNLHAKTGTLRNASGLAGVTKTLDGENIAFAFIFNGRKYRYYKQMEDEMASLIAGFFY
ncbi:D-alanyl-D-alanine carboxypeptidase/D-alanyl-D-alanine-endopeptidase, partial [Candidatus Kapabacteria bacterium]|nr:D-alanyl-D-alanine carboxypeptidase/D-alanyl-D-alanine-endopeptidase [Candidatus Kapabacteria bacterium]